MRLILYSKYFLPQSAGHLLDINFCVQLNLSSKCTYFLSLFFFSLLFLTFFTCSCVSSVCAQVLLLPCWHRCLVVLYYLSCWVMYNTKKNLTCGKPVCHRRNTVLPTQSCSILFCPVYAFAPHLNSQHFVTLTGKKPKPKPASDWAKSNSKYSTCIAYRNPPSSRNLSVSLLGFQSLITLSRQNLLSFLSFHL